MPNLRRGMMGAAGAGVSGYSLWAWGDGSNGQLGVGDEISRSSPTQIGSLTDWTGATGGQGWGMGSKNDGTLWAWGNSSEGRLGQDNVIKYSSPVQVGDLSTWTSNFCSGQNTGFGIKSDGTLWAWGDNYRGMIGDGTIVTKSSPVQVGSLTDWTKISSVSNSSLALKSDGSLYSWGSATGGSNGLGNSISVSSPTQIGSLTNWTAIAKGDSCSAAINSDGKLYAWGMATSGQTGQDNVINLSSPVQVGALTDWSKVTGGGSGGRGFFMIKTDGTFWGMGYSPLGDGFGYVNRSSPVQIGSLTTWSLLSFPKGQAGIATDDTLWAWGGKTGNLTALGYSSPIQVGSDKTWKGMGQGDDNRFGLVEE